MTANDSTQMDELIKRLGALFPGTVGDMTLQGAVDALVLQGVSVQNIPAEGELYGTVGTYSGTGLPVAGESRRRKETPYETVRALQKQSEMLRRT